jgi:hypothetical protein
MAAGTTADDVTEKDKYYLTMEYKREVGWLDGWMDGRLVDRLGGWAVGRLAGRELALHQTSRPQPLTRPPETSTAATYQVMEHMSVTQLIDIILINPTVHLTPSGRDTGFTASYTFEPLSNLVYTRDQQVGARCVMRV